MYHYTRTDVFEEILKTRRMWAMDLRTMNDRRELLHGKRLIDKRIVKAARRFRHTPIEQWLQGIRGLFNDLIVRRSSAFSISFSEHPDMANQWKRYAAQGTGFVLGWSIDSSYPGTPLKTWVTYDRLKQTNLIDGLIEFHANALLRELGENARMNAGYSLFRFLNPVWLTFKEPKWSNEAEFRYVYNVFDEYLPDWCTIKTLSETGRRYIEADFGPAELKYVGIGPKNEPRSTRRSVDQLLDRNKFHGVHVAQSTMSLDD